jgi:hypothetical protein
LAALLAIGLSTMPMLLSTLSAYMKLPCLTVGALAFGDVSIIELDEYYF